MKIVIAGGTGYLGRYLTSFYQKSAEQIVVLCRREIPSTYKNVRYVVWDGKTLGNWYRELEGAEVLINLVGRSVDCRYTKENKAEIMNSRLDSVKVLGEAVSRLVAPPQCWMQMSSATIYRHALDGAMDEETGEFGEGFSVDVCKAWEKEFANVSLPSTRKVVLRTGIVLGRNGGALPTLKRLTKWGLGGSMGTGNQMVSWIHEHDFAAIIEWLRTNRSQTDAFNCTAPWPVPNERFMMSMRKTFNMAVGLRTPRWMLELGAILLGTETELILKSRWVVPRRLIRKGFTFTFPRVIEALENLSSDNIQHVSETNAVAPS